MHELVECLYRQHYGTVYGKIQKCANGDWYLAEDAIQYAYGQLWACLQKDMKIENYEAWLVTVGKRYIFNYQRKLRREACGDYEAELNNVTSDILNPEESYLEQVQAFENGRLSRDILEGLQFKNACWYELIYRTIWMGESLNLVAEELHMNYEAARSKIRRAIQWIKKEYGTSYEQIFKSEFDGMKLKKAGAVQGPASSCLCQNGIKCKQCEI